MDDVSSFPDQVAIGRTSGVGYTSVVVGQFTSLVASSVSEGRDPASRPNPDLSSTPGQASAHKPSSQTGSGVNPFLGREWFSRVGIDTEDQLLSRNRELIRTHSDGGYSHSGTGDGSGRDASTHRDSRNSTGCHANPKLVAAEAQSLPLGSLRFAGLLSTYR